MDQNNQEVTIEQLLRLSVEQLKGIIVPVSYTEQVALPILRVIGNLNAGIAAIEKATMNPVQPQVPNNEPQIELVEAMPLGGESDEEN